jgi:Ca2+-binding RTX toxin-like protein
MSNVLAKRSVLPVAVALAIGLTATAQAKQIDGTPGNDSIKGSRGPDVINALAGDDRVGAGRGADVVNGNEGNDRIWGGRGADQLHGGIGDDRIWGADGNDTSYGEDGNDLMGGGTGDDKQYGGAGNDTIYAGRGRDESWGEAGDDTLWALARKDVHGRNDILGDVLHGGEGNDTFKTRDGEADVIDCGPGVDTALLDFKDVIVDATAENANGSCEVVNRQPRAKKGENETEDATPTTPSDVSGT